MRATKLLLALVLCGTLGATYDGNVEFEEEFDGEYEEDVGPMFASVDHDDDEGNSSTTEMPTEASSPPFILVDLLPSCEEGQFLRSNGSHIDCMEIPERVCRCPGPVAEESTGPPEELIPTPPLGCPVLDPPKNGAFVCTSVENQAQIYCSVLCTPSSEFSSYPSNPYACGVFTKFLWVNFFNESFNQLPQCNGFRYSVKSIFSGDNYLPQACGNQTMAESDRVRGTFCRQLDLWYFQTCSSMEDVYIQCGSVH